MKTLTTSALAALLALASAACEGPPANTPKKAAAAELPACPDRLTDVGDPADSAALEGKKIARTCVGVVGTPEASRKNAEKVKLLETGDLLTSSRVRTDLLALMKLGVYDDVAAYGIATKDGQGVVLVYALRDRPLVADFGVDGAKLLDEGGKLSEKLPVPKGQPLDRVKVTAIAQAMRDEYLSRGYNSCKAVVVTEPVAAAAGGIEQVKVRIKVEEGAQQHLGKLDFKGNKRLQAAELTKAAKLKVGDPYVAEEAQRARLEVTALYFDRGFVAVNVDLKEGTPDAQGNVPLTMTIEEGEPHVIKSLHVGGAGAPYEKEILEKVVKARPRTTFSRAALLVDIDKIREFFAGKGQKVEVMPRTEIDPKTKTVDLTFEVAGP
ncbi:MAG: yaeT [Labilithrix sp.]|nr:yaeT [Labilithrix sp.]